MKFSAAFLLLISFSIFANAQSYELLDGDTINMTDVTGRKQGYWIIKNSVKRLPGYQPDQIVEEGTYRDSRKEGLWKKYFANGNLKDEITYAGSRPRGPYKLYYENGVVQEEGNWERTKNTGSFKRYHTNGKLAQEFNFNRSGKREGVQKYFHENGQLAIEGEWSEGQESGLVKEYFANGDLKTERNFTNGVMDKDSYKTYAPKSDVKEVVKELVDEGKEMNIKVEKTEKPNQGAFDGNGYKKLYNSDRQISKDGTFRNYRLIDGKQYIYNENGILTQIMIFKGGKYIGDGVIEKE